MSGDGVFFHLGEFDPTFLPDVVAMGVRQKFHSSHHFATETSGLVEVCFLSNMSSEIISSDCGVRTLVFILGVEHSSLF